MDNRSRPSDLHLNAESVDVASVVKPESVVGPTTAVSSARSRTSPPVAAARRTPDGDPPVIVEAERALAIQRLRELMMQGRLDEKMLPPPVTPEAALAELSIAPLEIAEIRVPDVEIVGRPPAAPQRQ